MPEPVRSLRALVRRSRTADNGAKQWNLGYDYRFSKRTTVGFGYATIENDAAAVFTWSGLSSTQGGQSINPVAGSDVEHLLHQHAASFLDATGNCTRRAPSGARFFCGSIHACSS